MIAHSFLDGRGSEQAAHTAELDRHESVARLDIVSQPIFLAE